MTTTKTDALFLAVHGLAVKKAGTAQDVAPIAGLDVPAVEAALGEAVGAGHVLAARGKYMVTPAGRSWLDQQYPVVFADARARGDLSAAYGRFEAVNRELLTLMTRWQTVTVGGRSVPNDHADEAYDEAILDGLGAFHERVVPVLRAFAEVEPRVATYIDALGTAQERILAGERDYVSGARVPSYHTVWFELHEDLLRMLGRTREE